MCRFLCGVLYGEERKVAFVKLCSEVTVKGGNVPVVGRSGS
jgi:hypothetical protein